MKSYKKKNLKQKKQETRNLFSKKSKDKKCFKKEFIREFFESIVNVATIN